MVECEEVGEEYDRESEDLDEDEEEAKPREDTEEEEDAGEVEREREGFDGRESENGDCRTEVNDARAKVDADEDDEPYSGFRRRYDRRQWW